MKIGVALHGINGHQIHDIARKNPDVEIVAAACMPQRTANCLKELHPGMRVYATLEEMLLDSRVTLVSLCSPVRRLQAGEAIACMRAGKHVYAEKPCALSVEDLTALMETARACGVQFHEMAGTAFDEPYRTMAKIVKSGRIGQVVQVLAQKSYPFFMERPQDEDVDGGLLCQAGIHALRMIEHVAGLKILEISAVQTSAGNPVKGGGLHMAASYTAVLEGGGIASVLANYLNQPGFGLWGNEMLRIFGTKGFVETVDGGVETRLLVGENSIEDVSIPAKEKDYFNLIVDSIVGNTASPMSMEDELHPALAAICARQSALQGGSPQHVRY